METDDDFSTSPARLALDSNHDDHRARVPPPFPTRRGGQTVAGVPPLLALLGIVSVAGFSGSDRTAVATGALHAGSSAAAGDSALLRSISRLLGLQVGSRCRAALCRSRGAGTGQRVVGSNIANIALILGLSAILRPLVVNARLVQVDVPLMAFVTLVIIVMLADQGLGRMEGALLAAGLWSIRP